MSPIDVQAHLRHKALVSAERSRTKALSLRKQVKALHELLKSREWMVRSGVKTTDDRPVFQCMFCAAMMSPVGANGSPDRPRHQPDCQMAALVGIPRSRVHMTAVQRLLQVISPDEGLKPDTADGNFVETRDVPEAVAVPALEE